MTHKEGPYFGVSFVGDSGTILPWKSNSQHYGFASAPVPPLGPVKTKFENKNGIPIADDAGTIWHLIANDIAAPNWPSTVGGLVATGPKSTNNAVETPFYPSGAFDGVSFKKATTSFNPAQFFTQAYTSVLDFTETNETNLILIIRTGDFSRNETLISRYISPTFNHNCRIWTTTAGEIKFKVGCDVTDSLTTVGGLEPYTYYYLYFYWNGPARQTFIRVNGTINGTSTGVGSVINDASSGTRIGTDALAGPDYALTSQILEIWRSNTIVGLNDLQRKIRIFTGLQPTVGTDPDWCYRATSAEILVNNNLWRMGPELMRLSNLGFLAQDIQVGELLNSTFTAPLNAGTDWVVTETGGTTVQRISSANAFTGVGGQCVNFTVDGVGSRGNLAATSNTNFSGGQQIWFSFDYISTTVNGTPYYSIQNAADLSWYNATTNSWGATEVFNFVSPSSVRSRFFKTFNMSAGGQLNVNISSGLFASNISQSFEIYHVQIDTGEQLRERIVSLNTIKTKDADIAIWPVTMINRYVGAMTFECALSSPGSTLISSNRSVIGGSSPVVGLVAADSRMLFRDVLANSVYGSTVYSRLQSNDYTITYDWNLPEQRIRSTSLGVDSTLGAYVGIGISLFGLGQNGSAFGVSMLEGYIKNFTSYGV